LRAAVLHEHGATSRVDEFDDPRAGPDCVSAAGLHHLDLHKASGTVYTGPPRFRRPWAPTGVRRLEDGRRVYFDKAAPRSARWRSGRWCRATRCSTWTRWRRRSATRASPPGSRSTGALGCSQHADLATAIREAAGGAVDVTIDMLWGAPALAAMSAAARGARHVEVGNMGGRRDRAARAPHPLGLARRPRLLGRASAARRAPRGVPPPDAARGRRQHAIDVDARPLDEVGVAWERQRQAAGGPKCVLVP
jgi:hypothetical protein